MSATGYYSEAEKGPHAVLELGIEHHRQEGLPAAAATLPRVGELDEPKLLVAVGARA